jgi:glycosyltransferase involved in cell wall biosynthesis
MEHLVIDGDGNDYGKYPVKHIYREPKGQSDAMNCGVEAAQGHILGFLNDDDLYEPFLLDHIVDIFRGLPEPSFVTGNCRVYKDDRLYFVNKPNRLGLRDLLQGWNICPHPINPSAYFYHKSLHDKIGMYDVTLKEGMDLDFILRAVRAANVVYVDEIWGNYYLTKNSASYKSQSQADSLRETILNRYRQ